MFCGTRIDCIVCEALKSGEGIDKATMCGIGIRIECKKKEGTKGMCAMENEILKELEEIRRRFICKCVRGEITEQELNEGLNTIDRLSEKVGK